MAETGDQISKEKIAEYKEAFSFFDKSGQGVIETKDLSLLVRSLNLNPTEDEMEAITQEADQGCTGVVEFADFLTAIAQRDIEIDYEEELIKAFRSTNKDQDSNSNQMDFKVLSYQLKDGKDPFTESEIIEMQQYIAPNNQQNFYIDEFIKIIMGSINRNKFS